MKLIHCADLHLDSKMGPNLTPEVAKVRRQELLDTFERMIRYAVENNVNAIIIAGDLFDARTISARSANVVKEAIVKHPRITFFYLKGNHDCVSFLNRFETMPRNLKIFEETWKTFELIDKVTISGIEVSDVNRRSVYSKLSLSPDNINIVTIHGQTVKGSYNGVPGTGDGENIYLNDLMGKNIDYLALGHVHDYQKEKLDERGFWCYSGCLEGRGFAETGRKGFVVLDIKDGKIKDTFVPFSTRTLHRLEVNMDGIKSEEEMNIKISEAIWESKIPATDMVRLVLTGSLDVKVSVNENALKQRFGEGFFFFKADASELKRDIRMTDYNNDVSLKGEFVRLVMSDTELSAEEKQKIVACGLAALQGEDFA